MQDVWGRRGGAAYHDPLLLHLGAPQPARAHRQEQERQQVLLNKTMLPVAGGREGEAEEQDETGGGSAGGS